MPDYNRYAQNLQQPGNSIPELAERLASAIPMQGQNNFYASPFWQAMTNLGRYAAGQMPGTMPAGLMEQGRYLQEQMYRPGVEYRPQENLDLAMSVMGGSTPGAPRGVSAAQIRGFHGSPHKFDKFKMEKVGTTQGTSFGHGLYFTSEKEIAEHYAKGPGTTFTVTLHKGKQPGEYDYLKWHDKPDYAQTGPILRQLRKEKLPHIADGIAAKMKLSEGEFLNNNLYDYLAESLGSPKEASAFLLRSGVDGIEYSTGSLSGKAAKGKNYVVFDENAITIEGK